MKVRKHSGRQHTRYEGDWCSISVRHDGTGQVLLGFPAADGGQASRAATIPQVWEFLERAETLEREAFDDWVMAHLPPSTGGRRPH